MESKVNEQIVEKETKFNLGIKMVFLESGNYNGTKEPKGFKATDTLEKHGLFKTTQQLFAMTQARRAVFF